jgi:hypothetical protein
LHELYNVKFDADAIIDHFGSVADAAKALKSVGFPIKPKTLQKQRERGHMTANVIAMLALASVKLDNPIDLYKVILVRSDHPQ